MSGVTAAFFPLAFLQTTEFLADRFLVLARGQVVVDGLLRRVEVLYLTVDLAGQKRHDIFADAHLMARLLEDLILLAAIVAFEPLGSHQAKKNVRGTHGLADAVIPPLT